MHIIFSIHIRNDDAVSAEPAKEVEEVEISLERIEECMRAATAMAPRHVVAHMFPSD